MGYSWLNLFGQNTWVYSSMVNRAVKKIEAGMHYYKTPQSVAVAKTKKGGAL